MDDPHMPAPDSRELRRSHQLDLQRPELQMLRYLEPVPFTIDNDSHLGLSETQGLLSSDGAALVIEYRIADTVIGMLKSRSKSLAIPLGRVRSIALKKKFFGLIRSIELRTLGQQDLNSLLEGRQGGLSMKIRWRDRGAAENFCLELSQAVLRSRREEIDEAFGL